MCFGLAARIELRLSHVPAPLSQPPYVADAACVRALNHRRWQRRPLQCGSIVMLSHSYHVSYFCDKSFRSVCRNSEILAARAVPTA